MRWQNPLCGKCRLRKAAPSPFFFFFLPATTRGAADPADWAAPFVLYPRRGAEIFRRRVDYVAPDARGEYIEKVVYNVYNILCIVCVILFVYVSFISRNVFSLTFFSLHQAYMYIIMCVFVSYTLYLSLQRYRYIFTFFFSSRTRAVTLSLSLSPFRHIRSLASYISLCKHK